MISVSWRRPRSSESMVIRSARVCISVPWAMPIARAGMPSANAALALGIPALAIGIAHGTEMHTLAERITIDSLDLGRRQLTLIIQRLLGLDSTRRNDGDGRP